jgi:hypothetical protein
VSLAAPTPFLERRTAGLPTSTHRVTSRVRHGAAWTGGRYVVDRDEGATLRAHHTVCIGHGFGLRRGRWGDHEVSPTLIRPVSRKLTHDRSMLRCPGPEHSWVGRDSRRESASERRRMMHPTALSLSACRIQRPRCSQVDPRPFCWQSWSDVLASRRESSSLSAHWLKPRLRCRRSER